MARRKEYKSAEEIAQHIVEGHRRETPLVTESGHEYTGDVFYSDIDRYVKANLPKSANFDRKYVLFSRICKLLALKGFWVHS